MRLMPASSAAAEKLAKRRVTPRNPVASVREVNAIWSLPKNRHSAAAVKEVGAHWGVLDARLARQHHIAGEALTLADITYGPHIHRWFVMPVPGRPETPHLHAWYQRLLARPAFKAHVAITPT